MMAKTLSRASLPLSLAAVLVAGIALPAAAAEDGTVGTTSTGNLDIDLVIPQLIRITGLQDIDLGTYDGDGVDRSGNSNACVRGNNQFDYEVTATSDNAAFVLRDGGETDIPYEVSWGTTELSFEAAAGPFAVDSDSLGSCAGGDERVAVNVPAAGMDDAIPGSYTDTLILTVEPL